MTWNGLPKLAVFIAVLAFHGAVLAQPVVSVTVEAGTASEAGPTSKTIIFSRTGDTGSSLNIQLRGTGSASWTNDLRSSDLAFLGADNFRVTIPASASSKAVTLNPETDNLVEGTEDFTFTIQPDGDYTIGTPGSASFDILDDPPEVTVSTLGTEESTEAGQGEAVLTVTRTDQGDTTASLSVYLRGTGSANWTTDVRSGDIAFLGVDRFRVVIPANALSKQVFLRPETDNLVEGTEDFEFTVQPPVATNSEYLIGTPAAASIDILDDAAVVTLTIEDDAIREKGDTSTVMTVRRTDQGDVTAVLRVEILGTGTASWPQDLSSGDMAFLGVDRFRVTLAPNQLSKSVSLTTDFDNLDEGDETITFEIQPGEATASEYLIGNPASDTLVIIDVGSLIFKDGIEPMLPQ